LPAVCFQESKITMTIKILIVDDSAADRLLIQQMLGEYQVVTANDGLEAIQKIEADPAISLVLLDINMPNMDGFQFLTLLKSDERYRKIRTVILTNYQDLDNEIKSLKLGAVDYIRKPVQMDLLRTRVAIYIELLRIQNAYEQKLQEQGLTYDVIFHQAPIGIAISQRSGISDNEDDILIDVNPMYERITGRTKEEQARVGWRNFTHPDDLERDRENLKKLREGEIQSYAMDKRYIKPDESIVWVHMVVAPLTLSTSNLFTHICLVQDITWRKEIEAKLLESERSKSVLLSHLPGLAYRCNYDSDWTMQYVSSGCYSLTGYQPESLINNRDISYNEIISPEYRNLLWNQWKQILEEKKPFQQEYEIITAKGDHKWVLELGEGIYNEKGEVEALEGIVIDISDRKQIENTLRYTTEHDPWTGLYNRNYLENLLEMDAREQQGIKRAVISINLSSVQSLSTIYGFHYTQEFIRSIVDVLLPYCTDTRQLFNTYENRFVFYVKDYQTKAELISFCETIIHLLDPLLSVERINCGIGVTEIDSRNQWDINQLLKNLLIASERSLELHERDLAICFYDADMEKRLLREAEVKHELARTASDENDGGLFLQYQPILDLKTNQICGFEALARIQGGKIGLISPLEFIPIAEKTKLIIPVGKKIIIQASRFYKKLAAFVNRTLYITINVSVIQLLNKDFCSIIQSLIHEIPIKPESICLEITESVFASNYEEINSILGQLKEIGFHIAIDDFGTGYSSLSREHELNVDCLKIDKEFINNLMQMNPELSFVSDIISMAHKVGHVVVAEGVEYEEQLQYLYRCGCDMVQGYLISRPIHEDAALELGRNSKTLDQILERNGAK
jgi:PAS domain S-box-containing protein